MRLCEIRGVTPVFAFGFKAKSGAVVQALAMRLKLGLFTFGAYRHILILPLWHSLTLKISFHTENPTCGHII